MTRMSQGSVRKWIGRALALLLAAGAAAAVARTAAAADLQHQLIDKVPQLLIRESTVVDLDNPKSGLPPYLGTVPLKVRLVSGPQPMKVVFAFEQAQASGWRALGTYETGWDLVPPLVPGSFLGATGSYRVRVAALDNGDSHARRVVTPVERAWSPWREFRFQAGNAVPSGLLTAPKARLKGEILQQP